MCLLGMEVYRNSDINSFVIIQFIRGTNLFYDLRLLSLSTVSGVK